MPSICVPALMYLEAKVFDGVRKIVLRSWLLVGPHLIVPEMATPFHHSKKSLPFIKVMGELGTAQYCLQHPSKWWEYEFCPLCLRRIDYPTLNPWLYCIFCLFLYCIVVPGHQQRVSEDTKNLQMLGSLLENSVCIEFIHIFSHTLSHLYLTMPVLCEALVVYCLV